MGSPAVAALIAHFAFWGLLVYGWATGALGVVQAGVVIVLWLAGAIGLPYVPYEPAHAMFPSLVAVLDIALVFMIFKGDVRLS
jgi:hypothetical protein